MTPFAGRSGARDAALRVLALIAALIGAPRHDAAAQEKVLRAAMHADLRILDRHWTTAVISVTHGTLVYDTLFALDDARNSHPGIAIQRRFLGGPSRGQERWDVTRRKNPWPKNDAGSLSGPDRYPVRDRVGHFAVRRGGGVLGSGRGYRGLGGAEFQAQVAHHKSVIVSDP